MKTTNFPEQFFLLLCVVSALTALNALGNIYLPNIQQIDNNWTVIKWSSAISFICAIFAYRLHKKHHPFIKKDENPSGPPTPTRVYHDTDENNESPK
ncbi:MAG: hypothetical protein NTU81_03135 [Candidatus Nomurabacteria bacterium]|nr:hypothetical protein [Candidatus Nomurabacteria bacterium]